MISDAGAAFMVFMGIVATCSIDHGFRLELGWLSGQRSLRCEPISASDSETN